MNAVRGLDACDTVYLASYPSLFIPRPLVANLSYLGIADWFLILDEEREP